MELKKKIRNFIEENLIVLDDEAYFTDDDNIFEMGFVNSLFAMKILNYIEIEFDITVENNDINIENFSTINKVTFLIKKLQNN